MKRVLLFLATNLAVIVVLSIVLNIVFSFLGIDHSSISGLLVFAAIFGFGGSFISLALSKWMAKRSTGAVVITQPRNATEQWLMRTVERQAQKAGIGMPEVAVYDSPEMNAFATGMNRNAALVAVSTGLLRNMKQDEVEAVLAHEVSHIANGDMVTLTLIQGVVNTFVIFFARLIAGAIRNNNQQLGTFAYFGIVIVLEIVFGFLASIIVMWFSRQREYRADAGAARLEGPDKMVAALERLKNNHESRLEGSLMAFGIAGKKPKSELLLTHPPLEKRIEALRNRREF
ncbi:MAG: protease HtpX [Rheinheimera sp.]|mgnify:CR=1 FL=1|uniref:protease HtpX n=1 Tax=Arsukibacterium sp. UBA3155 TaxID=1946058 RepID=UPI000C957483|nr:protease HtpX [Arsukibacterium sp. UBA3155]MAD76972.1 protease HtpX [Rheinheimera sp.]|tara:strand:- start:52574 stop:53434 length:861 start_codon:yes stop_codon:yes gene_type:complete